MASNAKKKTTMAKLNRENAVRERRLLKQAKKNARKQASAARRDGVGDAAAGREEQGSPPHQVSGSPSASADGPLGVAPTPTP